MPLLSHRKCPCCFDCGECIRVFSIFTDCAIPALDGTWATCKNNPLAAWAEPSETAVGLNGENWVYATEVYQAPGGGGCSWQAAQYCVADAGGHRGRAWIVDLWLHDDAAGTTVRYSSGRVTDWVCTCDGPRFTWSLPEITDLGCFGRTGDACEDCTGKCLRVTLPALASNPFSPDCGPQPTDTQDVDIIFGVPKTVPASGTAPDVTTWTIETECGISGVSDLTLTYECPTQGLDVSALYRRSGDCFGTYTRVSGDTTYMPATLSVTDCCSPTTDYCNGCEHDCLTASIPAFNIAASACNVPATTLNFPLFTSGVFCNYPQDANTYLENGSISWTGAFWRLTFRAKATGGANCPVGTGSVSYKCDTCTGDYVYESRQFAGETGFPAGPITVAAC